MMQVAMLVQVMMQAMSDGGVHEITKLQPKLIIYLT
jgi:hypothetical protein